MKHVRNLFILLFLIFFVAYLLGSFFAVSFNIAEWEAQTRQSVVIGSVIAVTVGSLVYGFAQDI